MVAPAKPVHCYPNNKTWVKQEIKDVMNRKKAAFRSKDKEETKSVQLKGGKEHLQEEGGAEA